MENRKKDVISITVRGVLVTWVIRQREKFPGKRKDGLIPEIHPA